VHWRLALIDISGTGTFPIADHPGENEFNRDASTGEAKHSDQQSRAFALTTPFHQADNELIVA
jgi:hypothetical protein